MRLGVSVLEERRTPEKATSELKSSLDLLSSIWLKTSFVPLLCSEVLLVIREGNSKVTGARVEDGFVYLHT